MKLALVDADIVGYRCAASCEPTKAKPFLESVDDAIKRTDELCYRILNDTQIEEYRFFLSGTDNFRKQLCPDYKANRSTTRRPTHLDAVREFLIAEWKGEVCAGYEADDGIGIAAAENTIICSIDKDLLQIPGSHYNFVKSEFYDVGDREAAFNFWSSLLVGDASDNVRGVDGIGKVGARRILESVSPEDMEGVVRGFFGREQDFLLAYRLLRILRSRKELEEIETFIREEQGQKLAESSS